MELPKTEAELQAIIDQNVKEATDNLTSKHNGEMASLRTRHSAELEKAKKEASMSAEELANQRAKEMAQAEHDELVALRSFKKETLVKDKVSAAGLPPYFVHDNRLLSAEEGELDKVIKVVKGEYEASQPKGNTHSSVVQTGGATKPQNDKSTLFEDVGNAISSLVK